MSIFRGSWACCSTGMLLLGLASPASASMNLQLLNANFNSQPLDTQIGTGGASVGQPISVSTNLLAQVKSTPFQSSSLNISATGTLARKVRFEFIDREELLSGQLHISFAVRTPAVPDDFELLIREANSGSTFGVGGLRFNAAGDLLTNDSGPSTLIRAYPANQTLRFEFVYQLVAGTYDLYVNGGRVITDRAHAAADLSKGIGSLLFGFPTGGGTQEWAIDDVRVFRIAALLNADFNDKPLGMQIGTGGAAVGEPVSLDPTITAVVEAGPYATPALRVAQANSGSNKVAWFELLDSQEVTQGVLHISLRIHAPLVLDRFRIRIREQGGAAYSLGGLYFHTTGDIHVEDATGGGVIGSYMPGDTILVEFRYAVGLGTYDIYLNRALAISDRAHGATTLGRGIGSILVSTDWFTFDQWTVDDIYVYQPPGIIFQDSFD